ncbi:MAG: hypothetical protein HY597_03865 [Candidatus Omnitrophica bacterium]|nr:hypothetical protein [Candidatus Omnitrophota bacterium]
MRRLTGLVAIGLCCVLPGTPLAADPVWRRLGEGLREPGVLAVAVDPAEPHRLYVGTTRRVYGSTDDGAHWRTLLSLRGSTTAVHGIAVDAGRPRQLWAATEDGLWHSPDQGAHWQVRFQGLGAVHQQLLAVAVLPDQRILAGTRQGLVTSDDGGRTWRTSSTTVEHVAVHAIVASALHPRILVLGTSDGLFRSSDGGAHWERVLVLTTDAADAPPDNGQAVEEDAPLPAPAVTSLAADPHAPSVLYAGSVNGVYRSLDEGLTWQPMSRMGLTGQVISDVLVTSELLVATTKGVFRYATPPSPATGGAGRWEAFHDGLTSTVIHRLAAAADGRGLYVATEDGLFRSDAASAWRLGPDPTHLFDQDPSIRDLQAVAIRYAEVSPEKIARWRTQAARRAWLPTVSLSYNQDYSISDRTDEGSFPAYQVTDDKDLDNGWDVSVSWNLGDLIWNDDQTAIDVRSRLTAELRDDVLDEVNRLYFERRRLQLELALSPPPTQQERLERELRLQELTAGLDALTGGYLSRRLAP